MMYRRICTIHILIKFPNYDRVSLIWYKMDLVNYSCQFAGIMLISPCWGYYHIMMLDQSIWTHVVNGASGLWTIFDMNLGAKICWEFNRIWFLFIGVHSFYFAIIWNASVSPTGFEASVRIPFFGFIVDRNSGSK